MIDRNATLVAGVVISTPSYWDSAIGILRLEDPEPRVQVIHTQRGAITLAGLSGDGSRVLFIAIEGVRGDGSPGARQLYVLETDGSGLRRLTQEPNGVSAATMSADGRVAWYVSGSAFLKKLDLETSAVLQEVGPSPSLLATGQPAGEQPPSRLTGDLSCEALLGGDPMQVVPAPLEFAGLAPFTVGLYQISLRVPLQATETVTRFRCQLANTELEGAIATRSP